MIISLHYPKTAGTSFRQTLTSVYSESLHIYHSHRSLKDKDFYIKHNKSIVHGHLKIDDYRSMFPDAKIITWLRDPASRVLSYYNYCKYVREKPFSKNFGNRYKNFTDFINSPRMDRLSNEYNIYIGNYTLEDFLFIGIFERYLVDMFLLSKILNWKRYKIKHTNKSKNIENINLTNELRQIIYRKLPKEYELYKKVLGKNPEIWSL